MRRTRNLADLPAGAAVALVAGGSGPEPLRATLQHLPVDPVRTWCAVADDEEEVAVLGLAHVVRLNPWPGAGRALRFVARASAPERGDAPVVLIAAGTRLRSGFLGRAVARIRAGAGIVIGARTRRGAFVLRLRLRWLRSAAMLPGAGVVVRGNTLLLLEGQGWLGGEPLRVRDVSSVSGRVRVIGRSLESSRTERDAGRLSVTVLIPAYNERAWIGHSIRSVLGQTLRPQEIIVVDDASTDGTGDIARSLGVTVVRPALRTGRKGTALNAGLPHVRGDIVVVVDADTILHAEALDLLEREIAAGCDAATGSVFPLNRQGLWARGRAIEYSIAAAVHKKLQLSFNALMVLSGCIAAYRCDLLRDVGGFPDRTVGEDMDATWTLQLAGARLGYVPRAVAYTVEPSGWALYKGQMRRWAAAFFQNISVHRTRLRGRPGLAFLALACLWDIATAPLSLVVAPALIATGAVEAGAALWLFPLGFIGISSTIATYYIGVRRTLLSIPGFVVISLTNSYFFFEALMREWVLRRHTAAWSKGH